MFSGYQSIAPSDGDLATQALKEEGAYRFERFDASEAVTLGLSIRKRFRQSSRHKSGAGKGLAISIQTIGGHTLFACTVGDLGHPSGIGDISLDSWACIEGMISVVKRTGHSSFYVEKGMSAMGKTPKQLGMSLPPDIRVNGGAFPIWLENAPCCPIAVVAAYSGSSQDDHHLVVTTVRDYLNKVKRESMPPPPPGMPIPEPGTPQQWQQSPVQSEIHMIAGGSMMGGERDSMMEGERNSMMGGGSTIGGGEGGEGGGEERGSTIGGRGGSTIRGGEGGGSMRGGGEGGGSMLGGGERGGSMRGGERGGSMLGGGRGGSMLGGGGGSTLGGGSKRGGSKRGGTLLGGSMVGGSQNGYSRRPDTEYGDNYDQE